MSGSPLEPAVLPFASCVTFGSFCWFIFISLPFLPFWVSLDPSSEDEVNDLWTPWQWKDALENRLRCRWGVKQFILRPEKKWFQNSLNSPFLCVIFTSQSFNFKEVIILMSFTTQCLWIATFGSNSLFGFRGSYFNHRLKNEDQILKHLIDKFVAERKSQNLLK